MFLAKVAQAAYGKLAEIGQTIQSGLDEVFNSDAPMIDYKEMEELAEEYGILDTIFHNLASNKCSTIITTSVDTIRLGKQIAGMHPFNVWEFFLSNREGNDRARLLQTIMGYSGVIFASVKESVLEGFKEALIRRHKAEDLLPHLGSFAERVLIPVQELQVLIDTERWDDLIQRLIPLEN